MEVYRWAPVVMVRITAFLAIGILTGLQEWSDTFLPFCGFLLASTLFFIHSKKGKRFASGICGLTAVALTGMFFGAGWNPAGQTGHLTSYSGTFNAYLASVEGPPEKIRSGYRIPVQIRCLYYSGKWLPYKSGCHLIMNTTPPGLLYGEQLLIRGMPRRITGPANPHEFDYRLYLERQGIFYRHRLEEQDLTVMTGPRMGLRWIAAAARAACIRRIEGVVAEPQAAAITLALLIGITDGIDPEHINSYASTGTLHVLAVSGLHVGIICWLILLLLKPLRSLRNGEQIIAAAAILMLWAYALVTGLTPSVLRAVVMCTFVVLAKPFRLRTHIENSLAASAFLLMLQDPLIITRPGFLLSFLAVAGILLIHRPLHQLLEPESSLAAWCWNITCVSVASQYFTLPVTLYLFNQFPVWFIPANLVIIPLSLLVMTLGMALLVAGGIPYLGAGLAQLTEASVTLMNTSAATIEHLPWAVIRDIHLSEWQAVLLGGFLLAFLPYIRYLKPAGASFPSPQKPKGRWLQLITVFLFASAFAFTDFIHMRRASEQTGIIVYREHGTTSIDIRTGAHVFHLGSATDRHATEYWRAEGLHHVLHGDSRKIPMARIRIGTDTLTYLNTSFSNGQQVMGTWLVLGPNAEGLEKNSIRTKAVIASSGVRPAESKRIEGMCTSMGIPFHSTDGSGAFIHLRKGLGRLE